MPDMLAPLPAVPPVIPPVTVGADHEYEVFRGTIPFIPSTGVTVKILSLQIELVILVIAGPVLTVTGRVVLLQPVVVEVKVNVALPIDTPVTNPAFVTVATPGLLLTQVPPFVGDKLVVPLPQIEVTPVIVTAGRTLTWIDPVVLVHPVEERVKVNVAGPVAKAVTNPPFVTDAIAGLLLTQVPPVDGDNVPFPQMEVPPVSVATGESRTVRGSVVLLHPPEAVKVKVTIPAETPVTMPVLVTVATARLLLSQVPPPEGDKVVVLFAQIEVFPVIDTVGKPVTVKGRVVWLHPVDVSVNVKVALPADKPVTVPEPVTEATEELLLTHVPPVVGDKVVVPLTQILAPPVTMGREYTVIDSVVLLHPKEERKVKVVFPGAFPVTIPSLVTVATPGLVLAHVPPVTGDNVVVPFTHIAVEPVIATTGESLTVTSVPVEIEEHPLLVTTTE
jgi:hypothetical protein